MRKFFTIIILALVIAGLLRQPARAADYYRHQIGLNAHWALGGFGYDHMYDYRLQESRTEWVREHFYNEVLSLDNPEGWFNRYDEKIDRYQQLGIKVVGMLAYGEEHDNFYPPDPEQWQWFIRTVVGRYGDRVDAWEIWNEPDSPDYLVLNNPETFGPLLEQAYPIIKELDPGSTVIIGGLASPNYGFMETLYQDYADFFDAPAFHVYYCSSFLRTSGLKDLENDLARFKAVIDQYRPGDRAWVTEIGCSANGVSEETQKAYLQAAHDILFQHGWIARSFIYNFRKRDTDNAHENGFGILSRDMQTPSPGWKWYQDISRGPYDQPRVPLDQEQVKAAELKQALTESFSEKPIPFDRKHWPAIVNAYIYGDYPVDAIKQAVIWGGYTVHRSVPYEDWKNSESFMNYISRAKEKPQPFAYGQPRLSLTEEKSKMDELRSALEQKYAGKNTGIDGNNWDRIFKAYAYGGDPVEALVHAPRYGWKTVHPEISYEAWRNRSEYREFIGKPL